MEYCDHCGTELEASYVVESLEEDIASANKGESAVLCESCHSIHESSPKLMKAFGSF